MFPLKKRALDATLILLVEYVQAYIRPPDIET